MPDFALIVLARAIHVIAGVTWAGATFMLAMVVVPLAARYGAVGAGRWFGMAARRAGVIVGMSALLTVLSGVYLFAALHPHDESAGGLILKSGAAAALLSLAVGLLIARPAGQTLEKLYDARLDGAASSSEASRQLAALRLRVALGSRVAAGLLGAAVLAMAVFRYAAATI